MRATLRLELIASRKAVDLALVGRDGSAPLMAEQRDFSVPTSHGVLPARLYVPEGADPAGGALAFIHGGGFVHCGINTHDALCRRLSDASGLRLVSFGYRLAPEHPFPAQIEDGETAIRWLLDHLAELGVSGERLLIGGDSAGAYIAVSVASLLRRAGCRPFVGQVLIYPLLQIEDAQWASSLFDDARVLGRWAVKYIREGLQAGELGVPSLLEMDLSGMPPTLIANGGTLDPCRPDAIAFAQALTAAGIDVRVIGFPGLPHGFGNLTHILKPARSAVAEIGREAAGLLGLKRAGFPAEP